MRTVVAAVTKVAFELLFRFDVEKGRYVSALTHQRRAGNARYALQMMTAH